VEVTSVDVKQGLELPRWRGALLPGSMVAGPGARRSLRDWAVDATLTGGALAVGLLALGSTFGEHGDAAKVVDILLGLASLAAL
jgi:hypothetical protein